MFSILKFTAKKVAFLIAWCMILPYSSLNAQAFTDESIIAGLDFSHDGTGTEILLNYFSTGAAWFDYNNDGNLDLYVTMRQEANKLFKNNGDGTFTDVAGTLGVLDASHDGAGVVIADFNNDGWQDIFLANSNEDVLFKNNNGTSFTDITISAGFDTNDDSRGTSASWGDYDDDGYLDLYVAHHKPIVDANNSDLQDKLYHNNGNETFTDVSDLLLDSGNLSGAGFIGGWTDYDRDGDLDIFLVNDCLMDIPVKTKVFRNDGDTHPNLSWKFTEVSVAIGVDDCSNGMGIAVGDYNRDGWMDVFYTDDGEVNLYKNTNGVFESQTSTAGVGGQAIAFFSWGTCFFDYDLDGWQDLFVTSGSLKQASSTSPEPNMLFRNNGNGINFDDVSDAMGMNDDARSRTAVFGDYDNDGDPDMFIVNYAEQVILKRNNIDNGNHYLKVHLVGTVSNFDGIGSYLKLETPDGMTQYFETRSGSSLGGGDAIDAYFGLGSNTSILSIEVTWPSGIVQTLENLSADQYLTIQEPNNPCLSLTIPAPVGADAESCSGEPFPELSATSDSGLEIDWYDSPSDGVLLSQNSTTYTPVSEGTFYVESRDPSNGCTSETRTPISLVINENPTVNGGLNEFACLGTPVTFTAVASGGDGSYSFDWPDGLSNTASLTVAPPEHTSYTVTVTDGNGCSGTDLVTAVVYELPVVTAAQDIAICEEECTILEATALAGTSPYSYGWPNDETEVCPNQTTTYVVTVTDLNGCTDEDELIVTIKPAPFPDAGEDAIICDQECYTYMPSASEGISPYSFEWSSTNQSMVCPTEETTYTLTVTGDNGCSATDEITLTVAELPLVDAGNDISLCLGECYTFAPVSSGGTEPYTLTWNTGEETVCPTETTTFSVTIIDANGCSNTDEITITVLPLPSVNAGEDTSLCLGECYTFSPTASGGTGVYDYSWSGGETTVCPTETTTYSVTVTDAAGCTAVDEIEIIVFSIPVVDAGDPVGLCLGECYSFIPVSTGGTPPYTLNWNTGAETVCPTETTTYSVTIVDANGCSSVDDITISINFIPQVDAGADQVICEGECFVFDPQPSGGMAPYSYEWSSGTETVCPTETTTYSVTATDANGCSATDDITIFVSDTPFTDAGLDVSICQGECFTFNPVVGGGAPPFTLNWSSGNSTVCPAVTTTYTLTVTDANGCSSIDNLIVTVLSLPDVDAGEDTDLCLGECYTLAPVATGGVPPYNFSWSGDEAPTGIVCPEINSSYEVTVSDANGCTNIDQIDISITTPLPPVVQQGEVCEGDCINYSASEFNLSSFVVENDFTSSLTFCEEGVFEFDALDNSGCTTSIEFTILTQPLPLANAGENQTLTCNITEVIIGQMEEEGVSYEWSNGPTTSYQTVNEPGIYIITSTNILLGCSTSDTVMMFINTEAPFAEAGETIELTCATPTATVDGSASSQGDQYSYSWQSTDGEITSGATSLTPEIGSPGTYILTVTNEENGCSSQDILIVTSADEPELSIGSVTDVECTGASTGSVIVSGTGGLPDYGYLWSNGATTPTISAIPAGDYNVTLTDQNNCEVMMEVTINEPPLLVSILSATAETGIGLENGTISATVNGGTPEYYYEWNTGSSSSMITGLSPELYFLTITDANGCITVDSARVNSFDCQSISTETSGNFYICPQSLDGSIQIDEISGGQAPYSIIWSTTSMENNIMNLHGGYYSTTITDNDNCEVILQFEITEEDTIPPTLLTQDITLYLDESGSASFNSEMIDAGSSDNCSNVNFDIDNIEIDCSSLGSYEQMVVLSDENGNYDSTEVLITVLDTLPPEYIYCPENIVSLNCESVVYDLPQATDNCQVANMELTEGFSPGQTFPVGSTTVIYSTQDNSGNVTNCSFIVTLQNTLEVQSQLSDYSCDPENPFTALLLPSGGTVDYTYLWDDGNTDIENSLIAPGPWSWTVTDNQGCSQSGIIEAVISDTIDISLQPTAETEMESNGAIETIINGGAAPFTFQWEDEAGNPMGSTSFLSDIPAGLYCLTVTDSDDCMATSCVVVDRVTQVIDHSAYSSIQISPNPTSGMLNVAFDFSKRESATLILIDINGQKILQSETRAGWKTVELDMRAYPVGVYLLKIIIADAIIVKKVIVNR
jgi:hypothetical protein